jgi:hypothetical protein
MEIVYYDLQTTGLNRDAQICSIGATTVDGKEFHQYMIPTCPIFKKATKVHGMTSTGYYPLTKLFLHGNHVTDAVPAIVGLRRFLKFLFGDVCKDNPKMCLVLVS